MSEPLPLAAACVRLRGKPGRPPLDDGEKSRRAEERKARQAAELAKVQPRLFNLQSAARYTSLSVWTLRDLIANGTLKRVMVQIGQRDVRLVLLDRNDLDRLIESWKAPA